jgi:hypothetical protein
MISRHVRIAVTMLALASAAGTLRAQLAPPGKPLSVRFMALMTIPAFGYADYTSDIGWKGQAVVSLRKGSYNSVRLEGEYNTVGSALSSGGQFDVYGGGIGGARVFTKGKVEQEGYLVVGGYQWDGTRCATISTCDNYTEIQFGTKIGSSVVLGRGQGRVMFDLHWLSTWSEPYVNMIAIGGGLRL